MKRITFPTRYTCIFIRIISILCLYVVLCWFFVCVAYILQVGVDTRENEAKFRHKWRKGHLTLSKSKEVFFSLPRSPQGHGVRHDPLASHVPHIELVAFAMRPWRSP